MGSGKWSKESVYVVQEKKKGAFLCIVDVIAFSTLNGILMATAVTRALIINLADSSAKVVGQNSNHIGIDVTRKVIDVFVRQDACPEDAHPPLATGVRS